ncbi:hypothetical protein DZ860_16280 [Vibrio sinensis]|uniref:Chromosome partitioning protein ParA n=1 Tax=Vibrio sinensis TaxID=2302434 RepID=A0A3A6QFA3_9VIBR|nr:hypothetical protein [Vibrio sinensis]RJX68807.1 hypothetical protein DZ860_16280 [Vibrio sinensis]
MNKKISLIAVSVALALSGCGSDDSNSSTATPVTGKFIDNAVEGMFYTTTSGKSGLTGSEGEYQAMSGDTITFYIGGKNGLKVGAGSTRDVLTPFEAAGKYERAVNLAILLQSLDSVKDDNVLTIPDELRNPSSDILKKMVSLSLDNRDSVEAFISSLGNDYTIVDEEAAIAHMNDSFGEMIRGGEGRNPFIQQGKFVRQIQVTQNATQSGTTNTFIHADTMMDETLYNRTRGMSEMTIEMADADNIRVMAGSIDSSISGVRASAYLTCLDKGHEWSEDSNSCSTDVALNPKFSLDGNYQYLLRDITKASKTDEAPEDRKVFMPFRADTIAQLNHYTANHVRNDRAPNEDKDRWKRETMSGSYDPVTGIYTEIMKDTSLVIGSNDIACDSTGNNCTDSRTSEKVFYSYNVEKDAKGNFADRYIDFVGTWETTAICNDGQSAVMTTVFTEEGQYIKGQECGTGGSNDSYYASEDQPTSPQDITDTDLYKYDVTSDMWWFGQTGRESKATLTELNTLVRYCDADNYQQGEPCVENNGSGGSFEPIYYVKWEYQPAGKNWDQGLLIRTKTNRSGQVEDFSIMQKVK